MQFSCPTFLLSDWNLNNKQDSQYLVYHASIMYSQTHKRAVGIDWFGVCKKS